MSDEPKGKYYIKIITVHNCSTFKDLSSSAMFSGAQWERTSAAAVQPGFTTLKAKDRTSFNFSYLPSVIHRSGKENVKQAVFMSPIIY